MADTSSGAGREQVRETLAAALMENRAYVLERAVTYFLCGGVPAALMEDLVREAGAAGAAAERMDAELDRRYGTDRKGVARLDKALGVVLIDHMRDTQERARALVDAAGVDLQLALDRLAGPGAGGTPAAADACARAAVERARADVREMLANLERPLREWGAGD